jgi:hypothetical protein
VTEIRDLEPTVVQSKDAPELGKGADHGQSRLRANSEILGADRPLDFVNLAIEFLPIILIG